MTIGVNAVVARRVGEKNLEQAARAAVQSILLGVAVAVLLGTIGALFGPRLLAAMGADAGVLRVGSTFSRVMVGGSGTVLLLFLINAIFRGAGDAALAMRVLWLANAINIVLGPCFIFGLGPFPELGVIGAAVGTTIGRGCGVLYQLAHLVRGDGRIAIRRQHLVLDLDVMKAILRISGTATFQNFVGTASWMGLVYILTSFGSDAVAGNTIGIRIIIFACLPAWGVSNAAATLVGQNLGAGRPDRAEASAIRAAWYNTACLGIVGAFFLVFAPQIVSLFSSDAAVAGYGSRCLRIVAAGFPFYGFAYVMIAAFNGSGDTRTPTIINIACLWLWEIPLAWVLAHPAGFGPTGVFTAVAVAFSTMAVVSTVLFHRGDWKTRRV
jgi:putative MATE family efflux protein